MDFAYQMDSLLDLVDIPTSIMVDQTNPILDTLIYDPLMRNLEDLSNDVVWELTDFI